MNSQVKSGLGMIPWPPGPLPQRLRIASAGQPNRLETRAWHAFAADALPGGGWQAYR